MGGGQNGFEGIVSSSYPLLSILTLIHLKKATDFPPKYPIFVFLPSPTKKNRL